MVADKPVPEKYFARFKRNGFVIHFTPLEKPVSREASVILNNLKQTHPDKSKTWIYVKSGDMVYPRFGNPFYRIKGLAFIGEPYLVVSLGKAPLKQTQQTILHEFGHTLGLRHCAVKNCMMNDAKGSMKNVRNSTSFCRLCATVINKYLPVE